MEQQCCTEDKKRCKHLKYTMRVKRKSVMGGLILESRKCTALLVFIWCWIMLS